MKITGTDVGNGPRVPSATEAKATHDAAAGVLTRMNHGLPPNLHLAPRLVLLKTIRDLHAEI